MPRQANAFPGSDGTPVNKRRLLRRLRQAVDRNVLFRHFERKILWSLQEQTSRLPDGAEQSLTTGVIRIQLRSSSCFHSPNQRLEVPAIVLHSSKKGSSQTSASSWSSYARKCPAACLRADYEYSG